MFKEFANYTGLGRSLKNKDWEFEYYEFKKLRILKCRRVLKIIKFAVISYNTKLEKLPDLQTYKQWNKIKARREQHYCIIQSVVRGGSTLGQWGICPIPPDSLVVPQIQKLADHSDVISKVPKCSKIQIFRGPPGELTALMRRGSLPPAKNPTPAVSPCIYGLRVQPIAELATY